MKRRYVSHFVHYVRMHSTESYGHGRAFQLGRPQYYYYFGPRKLRVEICIHVLHRVNKLQGKRGFYF